MSGFEDWEDWVVIHNRNLADAKQRMYYVDAAHRALVDSTTGLRRAVLDMHGPRLLATEIVCEKCEGYDEGNLTFPCDTYALARDWDGAQ